MVNPKSLLNLKQNRKHPGRPEGAISLTSALKRYLREHPDQVGSLVESWVGLAHVNPAFAREIWERLDGKVPQPEQHSGMVRVIVDFEGNRGGPENGTQDPGDYIKL